MIIASNSTSIYTYFKIKLKIKLFQENKKKEWQVLHIKTTEYLVYKPYYKEHTIHIYSQLNSINC